MNISLKIKKTLSYPLYYTKSAARFGYRKTENDFLILMYHRVCRKRSNDYSLQEGMYVDPDTFAQQVRFLKNEFHVIPLEEMYSLHRSGSPMVHGKPFCVLTFDDGWKDFYENAYPTLKFHDVCATVFLPTDYIGTKRMFWTEHLAHLIAGKKRRTGDLRVEEIPHHTMIGTIEKMRGPIESKIEQAAEALKSFPSEEIERIMVDLAERRQVDPLSGATSFLSWEEIREMRLSGIVSFGSHTKSHRILTTVSEDGVRDELTRSRKKLIEEGAVSPSFIPFAYPNGNFTDRIAEMVEESGYHVALTTQKGWNQVARERGEFYKLKRIGIHQDMTSTNPMLACRIYGIY